MKRLSRDIATMCYVECPGCNKNRLTKQVNAEGKAEETSDKTVDVRGEVRFLDVCSFCIIRYEKADEQFVKANLKKIQQAVSVNPEDGAETDHKDFSLDI